MSFRDCLWNPWRLAYLRDLAARAREVGGSAGSEPEARQANFIRAYWERPQDDVANGVVFRNSDGIIFLNLYPYANGHLLVALGEARPTLRDYSPQQRAAFWRLVDHAAAAVERAMNPQGLNIGINQGRAAGAGVPEHLHAHIVPRWAGDTSFMGAIGGVRLIPDSLDAMATSLRAALAAIGPPPPG